MNRYLSCVLLHCMLANGVVGAASFHPLTVRDDRFNKFAHTLAVSADGSRVGGIVVFPYADVDCPEAICASGFIWDFNDGWKTSSELRGAARIEAVESDHALGVRPDLSPVVIGPPESASGTVSFPVGVDTRPSELSNDAEVIAGQVEFEGASWLQPFIYKGGRMRIVDLDGARVYSMALSGNGTVLAGSRSITDNGFFGRSAFRWTEGDGLTTLPSTVDGTILSVIGAANSDGNIVAGLGYSNGLRLPLAWDRSNGTTYLPLDDHIEGRALDLTDDGALIVGFTSGQSERWPNWSAAQSFEYLEQGLYTGIADEIGNISRAVLWDENRQVHDLQQWLVDNYNLGDQLAGWSLTSANAISANGNVIAGIGVNPDGDLQGWVVRIPEPSSVLLAVPALVLLLGKRVFRRPAG